MRFIWVTSPHHLVAQGGRCRHRMGSRGCAVAEAYSRFLGDANRRLPAASGIQLPAGSDPLYFTGEPKAGLRVGGWNSELCLWTPVEWPGASWDGQGSGYGWSNSEAPVRPGGPLPALHLLPVRPFSSPFTPLQGVTTKAWALRSQLEPFLVVFPCCCPC